jgi:hypothetical protein
MEIVPLNISDIVFSDIPVLIANSLGSVPNYSSFSFRSMPGCSTDCGKYSFLFTMVFSIIDNLFARITNIITFNIIF